MTTATGSLTQDDVVDQAGERRSARIESLRALAAMAVLLGHVYGWAHLYHPEVYQDFLSRALLGGGFGVTLFFSLSGYLLFLPMARSLWGQASPIRLRTYALNRVLRVLPLYCVVMATFLVVQGQGLRHHWWRFALLLESFWPDTVAKLDGPIWSLVLEVQFYALLPVLALLLRRLARDSLLMGALLLLALGAGLLALRIATVTTAHPTEVWRYSLPAWAVFFIPGLVLALVKVRCEQRVPRQLLTGPMSSALPWVVVSGCLVLLVFARYPFDALLLPAWFLLLGACVLPLRSDRGVAWLAWRPLSLVGVWSYSLYLWHEPIVRALRQADGGPHRFATLLLVAAPLCLLVAAVSYHLVEAPFLRLRRRWYPATDLDRLPPFTRSTDYWEARYAAGATSGQGSYGELARFKADVLNGFVAENGIRSVLELGCGDGNQLALADYPTYTGYDVARTAIRQCRARFRADRSKSFELYQPEQFPQAAIAELALSLDVVFHLVEDEVFDDHLRKLFSCAARFVAVYSSNEELPDAADHVRHRRFTDWVAAQAPEWTLVRHVPNPYRGSSQDAVADFWFFARS